MYTIEIKTIALIYNKLLEISFIFFMSFQSLVNPPDTKSRFLCRHTNVSARVKQCFDFSDFFFLSV